MDHSELTAEVIKLRIREEVPSGETGLTRELLRQGKIRQDRIAELTARLKESEADRSARLDLIHELSDRLRESEADREARFQQITELSDKLKESEADRMTRHRQIMELTALLKESEADRAARLVVIRGLEGEVTLLQTLLDEEKQRAEALEQRWQDLEGSFAVRQARRFGLIRIRRWAAGDGQG